MTNLPFSHHKNKYTAAHLHGLDSLYKTLSHSSDRTSTKKKPPYTHDLDIREEDMCILEDIVLGEEDGMDGEVTDIESDEEEKGEDDDITILGASSQGPKRARLEEI